MSNVFNYSSFPSIRPRSDVDANDMSRRSAVRLIDVDVVAAAGVLALFGLIAWILPANRRTDRPERSAVTSQYESRRPAVLRAALGVPYVRGTVLLTGVHVHLRHGGRALPPPEPRADSSVGCSAVGTDSGLSVRPPSPSGWCCSPARCWAWRPRRFSQSSPARPGTWPSPSTRSADSANRTELDEAARSLQLTRWQRFWTARRAERDDSAAVELHDERRRRLVLPDRLRDDLREQSAPTRCPASAASWHRRRPSTNSSRPGAAGPS